MKIPTTITCANCGATLSCLTCFSVSVPENGKVKPADLCDLECMSKWVDAQRTRHDVVWEV